MRIPLGTSTYESSSLPFSAQRTVNMYSVIAREQSLSEYAYFARPGIVEFADLGANPSRGAIVMDGVYYTVNGTTLYSIDSDGNETSIGTVAGSVRVSMDHNGEILCIVVPGGNGYTYNSDTTTFAQITDVNYRGADTVNFKDGFYNFSATDGDVFFSSELNDPTSFGALDFGTAELSPDKIRAVYSNYDEVLVFGDYSTEVFENIGGSGFVWQRIPGTSYEKGTTARHSIIQWEGAVYFLGAGRNEKSSIFKASGTGEPLRISTDAIDNEIQKFTETEISNAFVFSYSLQGSSFIGWTLTSVNVDPKTFVFNVTASELASIPLWSEFQSGVSGDNKWRVASVDYVYSKLLVSDTENGKIGYLDPDTYTEYSNSIQKMKITPPLASGGDPFVINQLELTIDSGQGSELTEPQVMLDWSDDGARTWTSESWVGSMGAEGEYYRRTVWRRLGRVPAHRVFRFKVTDNFKTVFIKLEAKINAARS